MNKVAWLPILFTDSLQYASWLNNIIYIKLIICQLVACKLGQCNQGLTNIYIL